MVLRVGHPSKKGNTDTSDARLDFRNRYVCNADGTPRGGVTSPVAANLLSATGTMNVAVGAFSAVTVRDGGVVEMANDGPVNVLLDAPPSSQSRIDVVYVKQDDSSSTVSVPDADDLPAFGVLKGVSSATPVKRTDLPAGALELGTVLIPSTATKLNDTGVVITTTCQYTAAAGGAVPFRTSADLLAWTNPAPLQQARALADLSEWIWSGSRWLASGAMIPIAPTSVSATGTATIAASGRVDLAGVSAVTLNGIFSTLCDNYVILLNQDTTSGADSLIGQLTSGGAPNTTQYVQAPAGSVASGGTTSWGLSNASATRTDMKLELFGPALAEFTLGMNLTVSTGAPSNIGASATGVSHGVASGFDGIRIATAGGKTINGRIRVYGYVR